MKNNYEIRGEHTVIFLRRRSGEILETKVSTIDLPKVKKFPNTWIAALSTNVGGYYAHGVYLAEEGNRTTISLQRLITDATKGQVIDHINHNTLDNRRENLYIGTALENALNRKRLYPKNKSSGITGVTRDKNGRWMARIGLNYQRKYLGTFDTVEEAARAVEQERLAMLPYLKGERR